MGRVQVAGTIVLIAVGVVLSDRALSQSEDVHSVQALYEECTSHQVLMQGICAGYIQGVADAMSASYSVLKAKGLDFNLGYCAGADVTTEQLIRVFKNWHDQNPKFWHMPKELGVIGALQESWPCTH